MESEVVMNEDFVLPGAPRYTEFLKRLSGSSRLLLSWFATWELKDGRKRHEWYVLSGPYLEPFGKFVQEEAIEGETSCCVSYSTGVGSAVGPEVLRWWYTDLDTSVLPRRRINFQRTDSRPEEFAEFP